MGLGAEDWGVGIGEPGAVSGQPIADSRDWGLGNRESGLGESGLGFLNVFRQLMNKACKQFT